MNDLVKPVRIGIWAYFWLLLLEGALRKWIFPEWSDVLFIIRDPLVMLIYLLAWRAGEFPRRPAMVAVWLLIVLSVLFTFANEVPIMVTLFGLRTNYLHLPLIFVMAQVLNRDDVLRFGRWILYCSVPIVILMIVQFNSSPKALVNVGAGGIESGQLLGAMGRVRAPGPFSFISGIVSFLGFSTAFVLYGWIQGGAFSRILLIAVSVAITAAVPVSVSRTLLIALLIVAVFGLVAALRDVRRLFAFVGPIVLAIGLVTFFSDTTYVEAFQTRWDEGIRASGGKFSNAITGRILDDLRRPFELATETPIFGHGIGLGTVAGARLTTGKHTFLLSETEMARLVEELGPLLGFAFVGWRAWLAFSLLGKSWRRMREEHDTLPWLVTGASFTLVLFGQWGPATLLGFAVFGSGLAFAALNDPAPEEDEADVEAEPVDDNEPLAAERPA